MSQFTSDITLVTENQFSALLYGSSLVYPLGTDDFGRDLFTRVVVGARLAFSASIILVAVVVIFDVLLDTIIGYLNHIDNLIMQILDVVSAVPSLLLVVAIITSFGASIPSLITVLNIGSIPSFAQTTRTSILEIKCMEHVDAARVTGEGTWDIIWCYILPDTIAPTIVRLLLNIGVVVLTTSSLSFLGLGVASDIAEWSNILRIGSNYLETHSNLAIAPGVYTVFVALVLGSTGDVMCGVLDPGIH